MQNTAYLTTIDTLNKVIDSCTTDHHIQAASKMLNTFQKVWVDTTTKRSIFGIRNSDYMALHYRLTEQCSALKGMPLSFVYSARIRNLYEQALSLYTNSIENSGELDYSYEDYSHLRDELEEVEVGFFKDTVMASDSSYSEMLREEGFTMTEEIAYITLSRRIDSINDTLKTKTA